MLPPPLSLSASDTPQEVPFLATWCDTRRMSSGTDRRAILLGRPGPVRAAVRRMLAEAREAGRLSTEDEILGALAERYAALTDAAASNSESERLIRAGSKLVEILGALPSSRREVATGVAPSDDRGRILDLVRSGPQVGDSAHA